MSQASPIKIFVKQDYLFYFSLSMTEHNSIHAGTSTDPCESCATSSLANIGWLELVTTFGKTQETIANGLVFFYYIYRLKKNKGLTIFTDGLLVSFEFRTYAYSSSFHAFLFLVMYWQYILRFILDRR